MDDLRYPFFLLFFLLFFFFSFFSFFCGGGGGGWSSSRWLFGTQLGLGSRSGVGGRAARLVWEVASKATTHNDRREIVCGAFEVTDFLFLPLKKTGKIYTNSIKIKP